MKKLAITGNRPQGLNKVMNYDDFNDIAFLNYLDAIYVSALEHLKLGYEHIYSGGAIGVDLDFAEAVISIKSDFELYNVKLEIAIPCENQDLIWKKEDKERYKKILSQADIRTLLNKTYSFDCMQQRNKYMVDNADKLLVFWNGEQKGGTWNTLCYAKSRNKEIEIIDLRKL